MNIRYCLGVLAIGALMAAPVAAQNYPTKPIEIIVPFPAGGIADILPRAIAPKLSEYLGQPIIIINKPGAGGNTGTAAFEKLEGDGYTLLETPLSTLSVNAALYGPKLPYDPNNVMPVSPLATLPLYMVISPSIPANTLPEFIAYCKSHPSLSYASAGIGSSNHLAGEMLRYAAGIEILHVPFNGSAPALNAVLGDHVAWMFDSGRILPYVKAGKLKLIAVTTEKRLPELPDVPTVAEFYPGFEAAGWHGLVAPPNTPKRIIDRLNAAISKALADPDVKRSFEVQSLIPYIATPEQFAVFINAETKKWSEVVTRSGIKAE